MTYCVGMLVNEGLAMMADTRTNAGVDNISSYKKLHVVETPGERVIALATAGNLSVTQTSLAMVREGIRMADSRELEAKLWKHLDGDRTVMLGATGVAPRPMTAIAEGFSLLVLAELYKVIRQHRRKDPAA